MLTSSLSKPIQIENIDKSSRIDFENECINYEDQLICNLPKETYLYLTLINISQINLNETIDNELNEIGITSTRLFDHQSFMIEGMQLLSIWPEKYCTSVYKPVIRESFLERGCPLLVISLLESDNKIYKWISIMESI